MSQVYTFLLAFCLIMPSTEALADLSENLAMGYNLDDNGFLSSPMAGFLNGDPAAGKLVPLYKTGGGQATVIGIENVLSAGQGVIGSFIIVHVVIFDVQSTMFHDAALCLSPYDYGFIVLQQNPPTAAQTAESGFGLKVLIVSVTGDAIPTEGYLTLRATHTASDCSGTNLVTITGERALATWATVFNVGTGSLSSIPTQTAIINPAMGQVSGGPGAVGLIPAGNTVIVRFDVNPEIGATTEVFVWQASTDFARTASAFLQCEDELQIPTTIRLPWEVNIFDPASLTGMSLCIDAGQFRGVLRFNLPDTGIIWSQIRNDGRSTPPDTPGHGTPLGGH